MQTSLLSSPFYSPLFSILLSSLLFGSSSCSYSDLNNVQTSLLSSPHLSYYYHSTATLTLLLPLYCYTYSTLLHSTYYYLLLLATNCWLLLLFLQNLPRLAQDLLSCLLPLAAALCLLSSCCFFLPNLPSPLLCFADDEIIQVHTLYGI